MKREIPNVARAGLAALVAMLVAAAAPAAAQVTVEVQVATAVVDNMPQGADTAFRGDVGSLYCWTRVTGAEGSTVQHVWRHEGMEFPVELDVGGSPWRTWSSKQIPAEWSGEWQIEIRDSAGTVLETVEFTVGS